MKKGEGNAVLFVLLGIIAAALIILAANSLNLFGGITGYAIQPTKTQQETQQTPTIKETPAATQKEIQTANGFISQTSARLDSPFYPNAFNVKDTGVTLEIRNTAAVSYNLRNIEISSCGNQYLSKTLAADSSIIIEVPCSIKDLDSFLGSITLYYS